MNKPQIEKRKGHYMKIVHGPPRDVKPDLENSTKVSMRRVGNCYKRFVEEELDPPIPHYWMENLTMNVVEAFLRWYLDEHNVESLSGFLVLVRFWRIYYCYEMNKDFPYNIKRKTKELICTIIKIEYGLCELVKSQPPCYADSLLYLLHHAAALSVVFFPTQRQRSQHGTIWKMMTATAARSGTLLESSGYCRTNDALRWGDIELFMVTDPEYPSCQVLLMRVTHRLNKGKWNKGKPPIFTYTERNDNLAFCVIQDIIEFAFMDQAFSSEHIKEPRDIWHHTKVPAHRKSTPIHFKASTRDIPVFRPGVRDAHGNWTTHPTRALTAVQFGEDEKKLCIDAGLEDPGSAYKYRKGAAAHFDRNTTEHRRNHMMGHAGSHIFREYVNQCVDMDTQSVFLETAAKDALIKLSCHSDLTHDPSAPKHLNDDQKKTVKKDMKLGELKNKHQCLRNDLIAQYGQLKNARDTEVCRYHRLGQQIRFRWKKLQKKVFKKAYHDFFENVSNNIIEKNYHSQDTSFVPDTSLVLPEWKELADLDFQNWDASTVSELQLLEDCIQSLELHLALHHLHMPKHLASKIIPTELARDKPFPANFPTQSPTDLQCPDCLGNLDYHPAAQQYTFSSKYALKNHIDDVHLANRDFSKQVECHYPDCKMPLVSKIYFYNHIVTVHGILLPGA
ncbi:FluG domain-containing protein [Histoplasma ohiense]|nr:FluG domain-containing protein [Histoplasma ohiense (nom. inval.)]